MKILSFIFPSILLAIFVCGWSCQHCGAASTNDLGQTHIDTNLTAKVAADYEKYQKGQIDKGQMAQSVWEANNHTRQDRYGKVVDQDGQPVAGVDVTGTIEFIQADKPDLHYKTQTDTNGLFQFTGLHGAGLAVKVAKVGYEMDYERGAFEPSGQSSPTNRVIFNMWKLRGPEPMVHADTKGLPYWYSFFKPNEGSTRINLLTCRDEGYVSERYSKWERRYDLEIALHLEEPIKTNANRILFCNWSATIGITNGGLVEIPTNTIYPYEAPAAGYQPSLAMNFPTNMAGWTDQFKKGFYFKSENGKIYGRMTIEMNNRGRLALEVFANPAGSRNLEFDSSKQIR